MTKIMLFTAGIFLLSCGHSGTKENQPTEGIVTETITTVKTPLFNADSAYAQVAKQVQFGYRIPNTAAHKACGDYLAAELKRYGAKVYEQEMVVTAYDGTPLQARNIIGSYNPDQEKRILLFAHWDTRPFSDHDENPANLRKPIDGADDGGSGVGALLEIAQIGRAHV